MGNALPQLPDIPPQRLRKGKGVVIGCRVPEERREVVDALKAYCDKNNLHMSRVIVSAVVEYLKNHGGAR
jgi:hypothetical protein